MEVPTTTCVDVVFARGARWCVGFDEAGRGAGFGPLVVGAVLLGADAGPPPQGLADSKLLTPRARALLVPEIDRWVAGAAVGAVSAGEVDELGIMAALRLAAGRAFAALPPVPLDLVLVDGDRDWSPYGVADEVRTLVHGDRTCALLSAAGVIAKEHRDAVVVTMAAQYPGYDIERHKGYLTPSHRSALAAMGPTPEHRRSFKLVPGE